MAMNPDSRPAALEDALSAAGASLDARIRFLQELSRSTVAVLSTSSGVPGATLKRDPRLLIVSDGNDLQQAMLAVFTSRERADGYLNSGVPPHPCHYVLEEKMERVLLGLPAGAGIMLNPGSESGFRIVPVLAARMRSDAQIKFVLMQLHALAPDDAQRAAKRPALLPPSVIEALDKIQRFMSRNEFTAAEQHVSELQAAGIRSDYAACLHAIIARQQGDRERAAKILSAALADVQEARLAANYRSLLAQILDEAGKQDAAEHAYFQSQMQDPLELAYSMNLALFLGRHDQLDAAITLLTECARIHAPDPAPAALIAQLLVEHDEFDRGLAMLEGLIAQYPDLASLHYNRAICLQMLGRIDEAAPEYERALRLDPNMDGHSQYVHTRKFSPGDLRPDNLYIQMLEKRARPGMPINSRIDADFALAKIYDLAGDAERAFAHMQSGNSLKRESFKNYSLEATRQDIRSDLAVFNQEFIEQFKASANSALAPIFIVGMPRSGSTLTEQILAAHSQVKAGGEMTFLGVLADDFIKKWAPQVAEIGSHRTEVVHDLGNIAHDYTVQTRKFHASGARFTDKMLGNYLNLGLIYILFPNASVIHCRRHPLDTCLSAYERLFSKNVPYSYDLQELGEYYKIYRKVMQHWRDVLPASFILDSSYEQLVESPEDAIRRILQFCGLEFEAACLDFQNVKRSIRTASSVQVRKPLYKTSINRWRRYRTQLALLIESLGPEILGPDDSC